VSQKENKLFSPKNMVLYDIFVVFVVLLTFTFWHFSSLVVQKFLLE
jgi:hypothetical protein